MKVKWRRYDPRAMSQNGEDRKAYLREYREENLYTQRELAELLHTSVRTVESWETRHPAPIAVTVLLEEVTRLQDELRRRSRIIESLEESLEVFTTVDTTTLEREVFEERCYEAEIKDLLDDDPD